MARFTIDEVLAACEGSLRQTGAGSFESVSTDSRSAPAGSLFVALRGERFDGHEFVAQVAQGGAAGAVVERGREWSAIPAGFALVEVDDTLAALGRLARHHRRRFSIPLGAVGGANGKTTTKEMVGAILATRGEALKTEGNLNNEIGVPLTLLRLSESHRAAVVEMGINHPGEMTRLATIGEPDAAVITIIQPEHLEGLGDLAGVAAAEGELFRALRPGCTAVINLDDPWLAPQAQGLSVRVLTFGRAAGADVRLISVEPRGFDGMTVVFAVAGREYPVQLAFLGEHNAQNANAAFALAHALGFSADECAAGLAQARPYARRLNLHRLPERGLAIVDDCYNANPESMEAALRTVAALAAPEGRAVAVLGDMLELGPGEDEAHRELGGRAAQSVRLAAFFGPRSRNGFEAARAAGLDAAHFLQIEDLLAWLAPRLEPGDVLLVKGSRGMRLERVVQAVLAGPRAGERA